MLCVKARPFSSTKFGKRPECVCVANGPSAQRKRENKNIYSLVGAQEIAVDDNMKRSVRSILLRADSARAVAFSHSIVNL